MRADFAKQLTERERYLSTASHHGHRDRSPVGDDDVGGRSGMRRPYDSFGERKSFNENLNPLRGWLRGCVGKNWDKCYSELRSTFDARKVINHHILEHLYDYIETKAFVSDAGKVVVLKNYGVSGSREVDVHLSGCDWFVCPKSGMVRAVDLQRRRKASKDAAQARKDAEFQVKRVIDRDNVLHLIDGVWFHFTMADVPKGKVTYVNFRHNKFVWTPDGAKLWASLNEVERQLYGQRVIEGAAKDLFTGKQVFTHEEQPRFVEGCRPRWRNQRKARKPPETPRYHATKATASHKLLKQAGLV